MKTHTIYTRLLLPAEARAAHSYDEAMILTESVIDRDGNELESGTVFVPVSGGYDNEASENYRKIRVIARPEELVTVETMPDHLRGSHRAAGNWGRWPANGSDRNQMSRNEAEEIVGADADGYDHIVGE